MCLVVVIHHVSPNVAHIAAILGGTTKQAPFVVEIRVHIDGMGAPRQLIALGAPQYVHHVPMGGFKVNNEWPVGEWFG